MNITELRIKATKALKARGIPRPDPMQVVEEMKRIAKQGDSVERKIRDDFDRVTELFKPIFGEEK